MREVKIELCNGERGIRPKHPVEMMLPTDGAWQMRRLMDCYLSDVLDPDPITTLTIKLGISKELMIEKANESEPAKKYRITRVIVQECTVLGRSEEHAKTRSGGWKTVIVKWATLDV